MNKIKSVSLCDYENSLNKKIKFERLDAQEEQAKRNAKNFYEMGIGVEQIAKGLGYTVDTIKKWLGLQPA